MPRPEPGLVRVLGMAVDGDPVEEDPTTVPEESPEDASEDAFEDAFEESPEDASEEVSEEAPVEAAPAELSALQRLMGKFKKS